MILKVNQLANHNLRLADNNDDDSPMDADSDELSSSISEWRVNLKSWQNFMDSFITVRRRDETAVRCWRRIRISICGKYSLSPAGRRAGSSAPSGRDRNSRWITSRPVRAYYDTDDATTKAFLDEVDKLSQQSITMTVPETLQSRRCWKTTTRVRT